MHRPNWLPTVVTLLLVPITAARADSDTSPYLFATPLAAPTGWFEWDEFDPAKGAPGPHDPDVSASGLGTAILSGSFKPQPEDGPPFGLVTSTQNIYSGGTIATWQIALSGLGTADPFSTVVLQVAALGNLDDESFLLNDTVPTQFVDRGITPGVLHDTDGQNGEFDTHLYWAEWQLAATAAANLQFEGAHTHLSLTGARVDYVNSADLLDATPPDGSAGLECDFDADGQLGSADLDLLLAEVRSSSPRDNFDCNGEQKVNQEDVAVFVESPDKLRTYIGDSNLDGTFDTGDLVAVFQAGQFEDAVVGNSTWATGDWNGDAEFDTGDLVFAFQRGGFEAGPRTAAAAVPEPSFGLMLIAAAAMLAGTARRRHARLSGPSCDER